MAAGGIEMAQAKPEQMKRLWSPVKQQAADSFLILMIASFAITVIVVRVSLQLTGYPQVGNGVFHIAHLLWGGLLLFVAVVMVLLWANHWVLWAAALAGGVGVGLFIDEVGKFITQSNDYFFPLAFPIIYAFLLVCVWLYVRVRRSRARDTRTLLYHALEDLKQVLDHDLDPFEHIQLVSALNQVMTNAQESNEKNLAEALLDFVRAEDVKLAKEPNRIERAWGWTKFIASHWPSQRAFKWLLIVGFAAGGVSAIFEIGALWAIVAGLFDKIGLPEFVIVSGKSKYQIDDPILLVVHTALIIVTGVASGLAAILMVIRRERRGLRIGTLSLILTLTMVNLLTFYFSQLYAIGTALAQLILLLGATIYRWRFFLNQ
jgi:hypothetical protein